MEFGELISSPAAKFVYRKPEVGQSVWIDEAHGAQVVVTRRWIDAETAEDMDWFDIAEAGGAWDVTTRPPQSDAERAACAAVAAEVAAKRQAERDRREAARSAAEEQKRRDRQSVEDYTSWKAEHLAGLVEMTGYTTGMKAEGYQWHGKPVFQSSKAAGWYTTGDTYYAILPAAGGEPIGYVCLYGNASLAYVAEQVRDRWYLLEYQARSDEIGEARHAFDILRSVTRWPDGGVYGLDYYLRMVELLGRERLIALAKDYTSREQADTLYPALQPALQAMGLDLHVLEDTKERDHYRAIYRDLVDGSRWIERYGGYDPYEGAES